MTSKKNKIKTKSNASCYRALNRLFQNPIEEEPDRKIINLLNRIDRDNQKYLRKLFAGEIKFKLEGQELTFKEAIKFRMWDTLYDIEADFDFNSDLSVQAQKMFEKYKEAIINLSAQTDTPSGYQRKIRVFLHDLFNELAEYTTLKNLRGDYIRSFLEEISQELSHTEPNNKVLIEILNKIGTEFMSGLYPPNIPEKYEDDLGSLVTESTAAQSDLSHVSKKSTDGSVAFKDTFWITRGIGYKHSVFSMLERTHHRARREGSVWANYSFSAITKAIEHYNRTKPVAEDPLTLSGYKHAKYEKNQRFIELLNHYAHKIADDLAYLRNPNYELSVSVSEGDKEHMINILPIYLLQDIYTNDMAIFMQLINQQKRLQFIENYMKAGHPFGETNSTLWALNRNGILAKSNPEALMSLICLLDGKPMDWRPGKTNLTDFTVPSDIHPIDYTSNPFTSTGYSHKAAFDYSMERKTYGPYHLQEFFPNYSVDLKPQHPVVGRFYSFLLTDEEYAKFTQSSINVVQAHEKGLIKVHPTIIDENEMTFHGGFSSNVPPIPKDAKYPDLSRAWQDLTPAEQKKMTKEFGLKAGSYEDLRTRLRGLMSDKTEHPSYLREIFIISFVDLLRTYNIHKSDGEMWTVEDFVNMFYSKPIVRKELETLLKDKAHEQDSLICLDIFENYVKAKKEFHKIFEPVTQYLHNKYERDIIDSALRRGLKIVNLTEQGQLYQETRIQEIEQLREHEVTRPPPHIHLEKVTKGKSSNQPVSDKENVLPQSVRTKKL